ncbi:hypothetical protein [Enterococcus phage vB_EfaP_Ef6.2]|uniref:Uncharacterized protein n=2 Tax=Copernicusvirus TaxID=2842616 RepID=A0A4D6DS49_9CAUD|nr:hypothetical protein H3T65_gp05 [Enterococcus phage vB_EfaP_Ef6.2]YP_009908894.1 hypothetical protein H3T68_gp03 [Enterococcus phage vB_EfaP_Efmus4]QBZ69177.1 hypothetical protein [Enterococcus phage vB_EfaP_Ef6.2]QBZ69371.1 hypothetical protein [Enterococcus phage vB_EfaP_Efmus4]
MLIKYLKLLIPTSVNTPDTKANTKAKNKSVIHTANTFSKNVNSLIVLPPDIYII